jgi:hypothetical protein
MKVNFDKDFEDIEFDYPYLNYIETDNQYILSGEYQVFDSEGYLWDVFNVKIVFSKDYPHVFPVMRELNGKITKKNSNHINPDGTLCTCVEPKMFIEERKGLRLSRFLNKYALSFLAAHLYFQKEGVYPKEYSHGNKGIEEYYHEVFKTTDKKQTVQWLKKLINERGVTGNKKIGRNTICSCGSDIKYKKCHQIILKELKLIPLNILKEHLNILKNV